MHDPSESPAEAFVERRRERLVIAPCPQCGDHDLVRVTVRTDYVIYIRCGACGSMWNEVKPTPLAEAS
jgi:uncharacterized Zn finger protein